jgi:hypothetical protein
MNLQELNAFAIAGKIDELNLISMEGVFYVLEARMHGTEHPVLDDHVETFQLRSVEHAREVLHACPKPFNVVYTSAHDEMCGTSAEESPKLPSTFRSA